MGGDVSGEHEALVAGPGAGAPAPTRIDRDDRTWYFFTSGPTGRLEAAVLTHGQLASAVTNQLCDLMPGTGPGNHRRRLSPHFRTTGEFTS